MERILTMHPALVMTPPKRGFKRSFSAKCRQSRLSDLAYPSLAKPRNVIILIQQKADDTHSAVPSGIYRPITDLESQVHLHAYCSLEVPSSTHRPKTRMNTTVTFLLSQCKEVECMGESDKSVAL